MWHQLYFTHCTQTNSCDGIAGYSLRARSPGSEPWCDLVRRFPAPTRPDALRAVSNADDLPRQLAWLRSEDGRAVLLHSNFLARDTLNRPTNYFRHVLVRDEDSAENLSLFEALQTWDSAGWTSTVDEADPITLPVLAGTLAPGPLTPDSVNAFLSPASTVDTHYHLNSINVGERLRAVEDRRRLVNRTLGSLLAAMHSEEAPSRRKRLFLHAEPGLVVVLLACAARLFPAELLEQVTFTTYIASGTRLREYSETAVVGTYSDARGGAVEVDPDTGLLVDTFRPEHSVGPDVQPWIDSLIDSISDSAGTLALGELHQLARLEAGTASARSLREACELKDDYSYVIGHRGNATKTPEPFFDAFLKLKNSSLGSEVLNRGAQSGRGNNGCWRRLREVCLRLDPAVETFRKWLVLPAQLDELRAEIDLALTENREDDWKARWELLLKLVPAKGQGHWKEFDRLPIRVEEVAQGHLEPEFCLLLLDTARNLRGNEDDQFLEYAARLLLAHSPDVLIAKVNHKHVSCRLGAMAIGLNLRAKNLNSVYVAAVELLQQSQSHREEFCRWLNELNNPEDQRNVLMRAIGGDRSQTLNRLLNLFDDGLDARRLPPGAVNELLAYGMDWQAAESQTWQLNALTRLCRALPRPKDESAWAAEKLWQTLVCRLNKGLLLARDVPEKKAAEHFAMLQRVRHDVGDDNIPVDARHELESWSRLQKHVTVQRAVLQGFLHGLQWLAIVVLGLIAAAAVWAVGIAVGGLLPRNLFSFSAPLSQNVLVAVGIVVAFILLFAGLWLSRGSAEPPPDSSRRLSRKRSYK